MHDVTMYNWDPLIYLIFGVADFKKSDDIHVLNIELHVPLFKALCCSFLCECKLYGNQNQRAIIDVLYHYVLHLIFNINSSHISYETLNKIKYGKSELLLILNLQSQIRCSVLLTSSAVGAPIMFQDHVRAVIKTRRQYLIIVSMGLYAC